MKTYDLLDPAETGVWTHYTTYDGLPGNRVSDIALDSNGVLWVAFPEKGVANYDDENNTWTLYTKQNSGLLSNHVTCLEPDAAGNLYIGTDAGFCFFNPTTNRWDRLELNAYITCIKIISRNQIRIGSSNAGFWIYDPTTGGATPFRIPGYTNLAHYAFEADSEGRIWIGTNVGLWVEIENGVFQVTSEEFPDHCTVKSFYTDSQNRLWIGASNQRTLTHILSSDDPLDPQKGFLSYRPFYITKIGSGNIDIRDIYEDRAGNIWFAAYITGFIKYDNTLTYQMNVLMPGFPERNVNAIAGDRHGNIWFGLNTKGLVKYTLPLE